MGNPFFDIDKNVFWNVLELDEKVFQSEWHSFCVSVNLKESTAHVIHNGKVIADYVFEVTHNDTETLGRLMHDGWVGGHTGSIADIQIFSRALSLEDMESWTMCDTTVNCQTPGEVEGQRHQTPHRGL